ncbi:hypothetical protein [Caballeronia sp.]
MKKVILAALLAVTSFASINAAVAAPNHHRECHKVRVHHHWENRCH